MAGFIYQTLFFFLNSLSSFLNSPSYLADNLPHNSPVIWLIICLAIMSYVTLLITRPLHSITQKLIKLSKFDFGGMQRYGLTYSIVLWLFYFLIWYFLGLFLYGNFMFLYGNFMVLEPNRSSPTPTSKKSTPCRAPSVTCTGI